MEDQVPDQKLSYLRRFKLLLLSKRFVVGMLALAGGLALCLLLTIFCLKIYTKHGEVLVLKNVEKMPVQEALQVLKDQSLNPVILDSVFLLEREPNTILAQNPQALSKVKSNRTIYLTKTKSNPDLRVLPGLVGNYDFDQYSKALGNLGIKAIITEKIYSAREAENTILYGFYEGKRFAQKEISDGMKIPMGATLEFVVTHRGAGTSNLPNTVCKTLSQARFLIESSNLKIQILNPEGLELTDNLFIKGQTPGYNADAIVNSNTTIQVTVSKNQAPGCL